MVLFEDRFRAGRKLSKYLKDKEVDKVVLPFREAEKVAEGVGDEMDVSISAVPSSFISAPGDSRIQIGAVTEDGTIWIEDSLSQEFQVSPDYIGETAGTKSDSLAESSLKKAYGSRDVKGKKVAIISDGISSGFRESAVAGSLRKRGAEKVYVAAPVASRNMMADIRSVVDEVLCTEEVPFLSDPDSCYGGEKDRKYVDSATVNYII